MILFALSLPTFPIGAIALRDAQFAEGQKPTSINVLNCNGSESRLSECDFVGPSGAQSCGRLEDAEVVCQGMP